MSHTDTMQPVGGKRRVARDTSSAGLVLLYAPEHASLPPTCPVRDAIVIVGREPPPGGFAIKQTAVSRLHARLTPRDHGYDIVDLGSRNGTIVNGVAVREAALEDGDVVRIGDAIFKFVAAGIEEYGGYRIDGTTVPPTTRRGADLEELVGGMKIDAIADEIATVAKTALGVLVLGETGSGKEVIARALHRASARTGQFVAINCAAIPGNLLESELFGHKRGAFTGADRDRQGLVAAASGGTLFLDEIGDMPLEAQAKVLRMIESREITPLGSTASQKVDVRLVCATHRPLEKNVEEDRFRRDLFARINGYIVRLPPLRERKEDIYALVRHFLARSGNADAKTAFGFWAAVLHYDWPFNVRELEAMVGRAVVVARGAELDADHLPDAVRASMEGYGAQEKGGTVPTTEEMRELLTSHKGNLAAVGRALGKDRAQVHRWAKRMGLDPESFRGDA